VARIGRISASGGGVARTSEDGGARPIAHGRTQLTGPEAGRRAARVFLMLPAHAAGQ